MAPNHPTKMSPSKLIPLPHEELYQLCLWINEVLPPDTRENAILQLSRRRAMVDLIAPLIWYSFGTLAAIIQEITDIYPFINPPTLSGYQSNRVCNALNLLNAVATHKEIREQFLTSGVLLLLYPLLNSTSQSKEFEYLRLSCLGVVGALIKHDKQEIINYLLTTEVIPYLLKIMENGCEFNRTIATYIFQKMLINEIGLTYVCQTYERFSHVAMILGKMIIWLGKETSNRLLKHVLRCYVCLADNPRAREALKQCLPDQLKDNTFEMNLNTDKSLKHWYGQLMNLMQNDSNAVKTPPVTTSQDNL